MNATLRTIDGKPVLRFERRLAHPPEKVWRVVTDPDEMAHWFPAAVRTELEIGAAMRFSFGDEHLDLGGKYAGGEILELDPPKVYAFRWVDDVLRFELMPDGTGCLLVFTATLSGTGTEGDLPSVARTAPGWDMCLDALHARVDGRRASGPSQERILELAEHYVEKFDLGQGSCSASSAGYLLRFERDLMQPVAEVWACLVQDADPGSGAAPLRCTHGYLEPGEVTDVTSPNALEYTWQHDGSPAGQVRFELHAQQPLGCRLVLTQTVPEHLADLRSEALAAWQTHLELLYATLHGAERCWPEGRVEELSRMYAGLI